MNYIFMTLRCNDVTIVTKSLELRVSLAGHVMGGFCDVLLEGLDLRCGLTVAVSIR